MLVLWAKVYRGKRTVEISATESQEISYFQRRDDLKDCVFMTTTKKPLNLSIQGLFYIAVWLHDLDSNQGPSD